MGDIFPMPRNRGFCKLENPSDTHTMVATLRRDSPGEMAQTFRIPPGKYLPLHGGPEPWWELWTLKWRKPILKDYGDWKN